MKIQVKGVLYLLQVGVEELCWVLRCQLSLIRLIACHVMIQSVGIQSLFPHTQTCYVVLLDVCTLKEFNKVFDYIDVSESINIICSHYCLVCHVLLKCVTCMKVKTKVVCSGSSENASQAQCWSQFIQDLLGLPRGITVQIPTERWL